MNTNEPKSMDFEIDKTVGNEGEYGVKFNEPTTGEIVRALRYCADVNSICGDACPAHLDKAGCRTVLMQNAADRLESQDRTIAELTESLKRSENLSQSRVNLRARAVEERDEEIARAESAERERDAAIADFEEFMFDCDDTPYKYCANHSTDKKCFPYTKSCEPKYNKWRGLQPQEGERK